MKRENGEQSRPAGRPDGASGGNSETGAKGREGDQHRQKSPNDAGDARPMILQCAAGYCLWLFVDEAHHLRIVFAIASSIPRSYALKTGDELEAINGGPVYTNKRSGGRLLAYSVRYSSDLEPYIVDEIGTPGAHLLSDAIDAGADIDLNVIIDAQRMEGRR